MYRGKQQITAETRTTHTIMSLKDQRQAESEAIPPGARLAWSEVQGKMVIVLARKADKKARERHATSRHQLPYS